MKKYRADWQDLLKTIFVISYIIDHLGLYFGFFTEYHYILRTIGRLAMPGFCFFAGYNFKEGPRPKLLFFGLILVALDFLFKFNAFPANILIPIFIGQIYLYFFKNSLKDFYKTYAQAAIISALSYFTFPYLEYGSLVLSVMCLGYASKSDKANYKLYVGTSIAISVFFTYAESYPIINSYPIFYSLLCLGQYFLWAYVPPDRPIGINLTKISRYSLYIYFADLAIMKTGLFLYILFKTAKNLGS